MLLVGWSSQVKVLATKPEDPSLISRTHKEERPNFYKLSYLGAVEIVQCLILLQKTQLWSLASIHF